MYIAHPETQLTSYWPSLIYQGMSGEVREAQFECYEKDQCWNDNVLGTSEARNGTQLVTAPTGNNLSTTVLFYREEGGRFVDYIQSTGDPQLRVNGTFRCSALLGAKTYKTQTLSPTLFLRTRRSLHSQQPVPVMLRL